MANKETNKNKTEEKKEIKKYWEFKNKVIKLQNDKDYQKLVQLVTSRHQNFIQSKDKELEENLKEELTSLRDSIYPQLRELPYHFMIKYFYENKDRDLYSQYLNAIIGSQVKKRISK